MAVSPHRPLPFPSAAFVITDLGPVLKNKIIDHEFYMYKYYSVTIIVWWVLRGDHMHYTGFTVVEFTHL